MGFFTKPMDRLVEGISSIDARVNSSTFGRIFRLNGSGHVSCPSALLLSYSRLLNDHDGHRPQLDDPFFLTADLI